MTKVLVHKKSNNAFANSILNRITFLQKQSSNTGKD